MDITREFWNILKDNQGIIEQDDMPADFQEKVVTPAVDIFSRELVGKSQG